VRRGLLALAVLLWLIGGTWLLQGINVLPGSVMSGDPFWAQVGGVLVLLGLGAMYLSRRRPTS
jgi:hypothetical protein